MMNPYGWPMTQTDRMLYQEAVIPPLPTPAESVAERLAMLAHLGFNSKVWSYESGRDYWAAFGTRLRAASNAATVSEFWETLMEELSAVPLKNADLLLEKNYLIRPAQLPGEPVMDDEVMRYIRTHTLELRDRTRRWAKDRRELRSATVGSDEAYTDRDEENPDPSEAPAFVDVSLFDDHPFT